MTLLKYRVRCTTMNKWEYIWLDENDAAPTTCPADPGHGINADATSIVETSGAPTPVDSKGRPFAVAWPTEGSKSTKISHRWNDKTTWHPGSTEHTAQAASATTPGSVYQLLHANIIDTYHGKIWAEESLGKRISVEVDTGGGFTEMTEKDPHDDAGDYSVDYTTGVVTFDPVIDVGASVQASYWVAGESGFIIKPDAGKRLAIQSAEVQFSSDVTMTDTVIFELFGFVEDFAPTLWDGYSPPGPYPAGTLIPLKRTTYKTLSQFVDESNGANPTIKAIGGPSWRGLQHDVTVFPWNYQAVMALDASKGMEIRVFLEHDEPFGGSYATCTMYCLSEDE